MRGRAGPPGLIPRRPAAHALHRYTFTSNRKGNHRMPATKTRRARTEDSVPVRMTAAERAEIERAAEIAGSTTSQIARTGALRESRRIMAQDAADKTPPAATE